MKYLGLKCVQCVDHSAVEAIGQRSYIFLILLLQDIYI